MIGCSIGGGGTWGGLKNDKFTVIFSSKNDIMKERLLNRIRFPVALQYSSN